MSSPLLILFMYSEGPQETFESGSAKADMGFMLPVLLFRAHPPPFTMISLHQRQPTRLRGRSPEQLVKQMGSEQLTLVINAAPPLLEEKQLFCILTINFANPFPASQSLGLIPLSTLK